MVVAIAAGCGDRPEECELARGGASHPVGATAVVATLPPAPAEGYGEMVVAGGSVYVVATGESVLRVELATGASSERTRLQQPSARTELRSHADTIAWNDGNVINVATPTKTISREAPYNFWSVGGFDFDDHYIYATGAGETTLALALDQSADDSWPSFGIAFASNPSGGTLVVNCHGLWLANLGHEFAPVGDAALCAARVARTSSAAIVTAFGPCGEYGLFRVEFRTGLTRMLMGFDESEPEFVQADDDDVYFLSAGALVRLPLAGGAQQQVLASASAFALAGDSIYAITNDQLVKIGKRR